MTIVETVMTLTGGDETTVTAFVDLAEKYIAKKRYPFGYTDEQKSSAITLYEDNVIHVAIFLFNKDGAEGETSHNENGVSRSYDGAFIPNSYTDDIVPMCGTI